MPSFCATCGLDCRPKGRTRFFTAVRGTIPTEGLPPRPVLTSWEYSPDWSKGVVAAKSFWTYVAARNWREFQTMYPTVFDVVRSSPILVKEDGPDVITGILYEVVLYPDVIRFEVRDPTVTEAIFPQLVKAASGSHRLHRSARFGSLTQLWMLCTANAPHPVWEASQLAMYEAERFNLLEASTPRPETLRRLERMGVSLDQARDALRVKLGPPSYTDPR